MKSFNDVYKNMINDLWFNGIVSKPRNMIIKELLNYSFKIDPDDNILNIKGFETNINYALEELNWFYSGDNSINFSPLIKKVWEKYSDNGLTVNSNYGHRIFGLKENYVNQWDWVKNKLLNDNDSRQAVFNINDITDKFNDTKDFPCAMYSQFFVRNNKLDFISNFRSNDVYLGIRNDVFVFCEMQKRMAKELGINTGFYYHNTGSLHLYENDFDKVKNFVGDNK